MDDAVDLHHGQGNAECPRIQSSFTDKFIEPLFSRMETAKNRIKSNVNIDLALELMLLGIKECL